MARMTAREIDQAHKDDWTEQDAEMELENEELLSYYAGEFGPDDELEEPDYDPNYQMDMDDYFPSWPNEELA